jgi:hypothetical protein
MNGIEKLIQILALLGLTSCVAVPVGFAVVKTSQMLNENRGGKVGETLTEADYLACQEGDEAACDRCLVYGALGPFHCTMWHPIWQTLPTISQYQPSYGGADYNQKIEKRR